ncbi:GntP family permease [Youngiibacter multivorans]|uniref:H+/gluconate symporter-like permease n=1 Tax=Youngiibacter multivorans TaxID=937251 RepID=A0ABS4G7F0_9CLOT|nr:SLC13 family permease [Youngiibacter multivorans]MBP1920487.1 H+/gluconate symporter-like permease [Youngiibacter multivorans]
MLGVIGLLAAIAILIFFVFKGYHVLPVSLVAAMVAIISNNADIWKVLTEGYSTSLKNFVGNYIIMFFLGALVGEVLQQSGAARTIGVKLAEVFGSKRALLIVILTSALLSYGGVSVFVIVFSIYPIALFLFKEADVPKRLIPGAVMLGAGSFTMTSVPGSPALTNIIPTTYLGTTSTAAPILGIAAAITMFIVGYFLLTLYEKKMKANGEHFVPGPNDIVRELTAEEIKALPSFGLSIIPLIFIVGIILGERFLKIGLPSTFTVIIALFAGALIGYGLFWNRIKERKEALTTSGNGSIRAILNTASVVGLGGAIRMVPAFQAFVTFATTTSLPALISVAFAVNVVAAVTGSSSAGITIFMESMSKGFLANGVNPQVLHRIAAISAGVLDSLPHAGPNVTFLAVTGLTFKEGYPGIFISTCIVPFSGLIVAIILASFGIV